MRRPSGTRFPNRAVDTFPGTCVPGWYELSRWDKDLWQKIGPWNTLPSFAPTGRIMRGVAGVPAA